MVISGVVVASCSPSLGGWIPPSLQVLSARLLKLFKRWYENLGPYIPHS